jgi:PAS domain-containing protein
MSRCRIRAEAWRTFGSLFESAPNPYLALTPRLVVVAASDEYLPTTRTMRDEVVGRRFGDVFPVDPGDPGAEGALALRKSLERVVRTSSPDAMCVHRRRVRGQAPGGPGFDERWWSAVNIPVLEADGTLVYVLHWLEDVSDALGRLERRPARDALEKSSAMRLQLLGRRTPYSALGLARGRGERRFAF